MSVSPKQYGADGVFYCAGRKFNRSLYLPYGMAIADRKRLGFVIGGVLATVIVMAAFVSMRRTAVPIRAASVTRGPIASVISTNGKIEPVGNFEAHAPAPSTVKKIFVQPGAHVKAGQLLVQLDDADARAQAAKAEAQLRAAEADLAAVKAGGTREEVLTNRNQLAKARSERDAAKRNLDAIKALQQRGAASNEEVRAAQTRLDTAEHDVALFSQKENSRFSDSDLSRVQAQASDARAALAAARDFLAKSDIRAPEEGDVYSLPVRQGEYVNAGDLIVAVASLSKVQVRAFVDEPDLGRLQKGQQVDVTWDAVPDRVWHGTLTQLPTTVTTRGPRNVGEITCSIDNADKKLLPNVNVSVSVITANKTDALSVPREAVHQEASGRFVYQVVNDELKRVPVETSVSNLTRIEVTKGLPDDATVALGTLSSVPLRDGLQVRIAQR